MILTSGWNNPQQEVPEGCSTTPLDWEQLSRTARGGVPDPDHAEIRCEEGKHGGRSFAFTRINGVRICPIPSFTDLDSQGIEALTCIASKAGMKRVVIADTPANGYTVALCRSFVKAGLEVLYLDHHFPEGDQPVKASYLQALGSIRALPGVKDYVTCRSVAPSTAELIPPGELCSLDEPGSTLYVCCPPDFDSLLSGIRGCGLDIERLCEHPTEPDTLQMLARIDSHRDSPNGRTGAPDTPKCAWVDYIGEAISIPRTQREWALLVKVIAGSIREAGLFDDSREGENTRALFDYSTVAMERRRLIDAFLDVYERGGQSPFGRPDILGSHRHLLSFGMVDLGAGDSARKSLLEKIAFRYNIFASGSAFDPGQEGLHLLGRLRGGREMLPSEFKAVAIERCKRLGESTLSETGSYVWSRIRKRDDGMMIEVYATGKYSKEGHRGIDFREIAVSADIDPQRGGSIGRQLVISIPLPSETEPDARGIALLEILNTYHRIMHHTAEAMRRMV